MNPIQAAITAITSLIVSNGRGAITASILAAVLLAIMAAVSFNAPISIPRSAISATSIPTSTSSFVSSGFTAIGDRGAGCIYVRGASGGPGAVQDASGVFWQLPKGKPLDISCFGAAMDGVTDDTAAWQLALNAATNQAATGGLGMVTAPPGVSIVDQVSVPANVTISGAGNDSTVIKAKTLTSTVFSTPFTSTSGGGNILIEKIGFTSASQQTGGNYLDFHNCIKCRITEFQMAQGFDNILIDGTNMDSLYVDYGKFINAGSTGVDITGGNDHYLDHLVMIGPLTTTNSCGINITATGGTWISNSDIVRQGTGLCLSAAPGSTIFGLFVDNTAIGDTSWHQGMQIINSGGLMYELNFSNSWVASNKGDGVVTSCSGGGLIEDFHFVGFNSLNNAGDGMGFACGDRFSIGNSHIFGNSQPGEGGTPSTASGISLGTGISHFSITNNYFGAVGSFTTNTQLHSIFVSDTASDFYTITGNDTTLGFTGTNIQDNGTGTHKTVSGNF